MARKRKKKGHARRGSLRRRYGRSALPAGTIRMDVSGQLVLDPVKLEAVVEHAVEAAVEAAVEESVPEAVEESVQDLIPPEFH